MKRTNRSTAKHYNWKEVCDGWHFMERDELSIIAEKMPPHMAEDMHYHCKSRQFFYILSGQAQMRFKDRAETLNVGEGIEIDPGEAHQMCNASDNETEFLVISMPKAHGDRVTL